MTMPVPPTHEDVGGVKYDPLGLQKLLSNVSTKSDAMHSDAMKNMKNLSNLLGKIQQNKARMGGNISNGVYRGGGGKVSLTPYTGGRHVSQWVDTAIRILGLNPSFKPGIENMIMHESGGNPNATNNWDSNAAAGTPSMGLMQTIQPTFNSYALPGHHQILNPIDNLLAGLNYAEHRYGKHMIKEGGRHDSAGNYIGY